MRKIAFVCIILIITLFVSCGKNSSPPEASDIPAQNSNDNLSKPTNTPIISENSNNPENPIISETPAPLAPPEATDSEKPKETVKPDPNTIEFSDKGIEDIVRNKLNKPIGDIIAQELDAITELYIWYNSTAPEPDYQAVSYPGKQRPNEYGGIVLSLKDLRYFKNLKSLTIANQKIKDFKPLSELTELESLNLSDNGITDFSFLKNMEKLKNLNISYNRISDLSQITGLKSLERLDLSYNRVNDIKGVENLINLKMLLIDQGWADDEARIKDISPLMSLNLLETLSLEANRISDLNNLSGLLTLRELNIQQNDLSNIDPLISLINMERLDMSWNDIFDIRPLLSMQKLKSLKIDYDMITNKVILRLLPELAEVNFDWNKVPYPFSIGSENAQEGITPGNHVNESPVGFDGSSLYLVEYIYGDLPHPELIRVDLQTGETEYLSGQITEQMSLISGAVAGGWINEEVYSLNIYKGKLYYYGVGHNNSEADALEWGYYPGGDVIGLTRMNLNGSEREFLTTEECKLISINNDKIYYLNSFNQPSSMELDGSNPVILVDKQCRFVYATDEKLYYSFIGVDTGLMSMSFNNSVEEVVIDEEVISPIITEEAIYYLNDKGNICRYDLNAKTSQVINKCSASSINMNHRYIFFADNDNIYRMDNDGRNETIIRENGAWNLFVVGDYIFFYYDGGLAKIKDDGSEYIEYFEYY